MSKISDASAIKAAETLVEFCNQQKACQNCIFRLYGAEEWKCNIKAYDLREAVAAKASKSRHQGFI